MKPSVLLGLCASTVVLCGILSVSVGNEFQEAEGPCFTRSEASVLEVCPKLDYKTAILSPEGVQEGVSRIEGFVRVQEDSGASASCLKYVQTFACCDVFQRCAAVDAESADLLAPCKDRCQAASCSPGIDESACDNFTDDRLLCTDQRGAGKPLPVLEGAIFLAGMGGLGALYYTGTKDLDQGFVGQDADSVMTDRTSGISGLTSMSGTTAATAKTYASGYTGVSGSTGGTWDSESGYSGLSGSTGMSGYSSAGSRSSGGSRGRSRSGSGKRRSRSSRGSRSGR